MALLDLHTTHDAVDERVGSSYPRCSDGNGTLSHLFFSDDEFDIARAKAICSRCGLAETCLSDAIDRGELTNAIPPRLAGALAVVHLSAAIAHSLAGQDVDIDELSEALLDQWLKGMQP